jgi:hypothetical protein
MNRDWADIPQPEKGVRDFSASIFPVKESADAKVLLMETACSLKAIESLLLNPTPEHIREAAQLMDNAARHLQRLQAEPARAEWGRDELCSETLAVQRISRRVLALLNGALRVQWHRLRRMGLYLESYTAAGKTTVHRHHLPRLDLKL